MERGELMMMKSKQHSKEGALEVDKTRNKIGKKREKKVLSMEN